MIHLELTGCIVLRKKQTVTNGVSTAFIVTATRRRTLNANQPTNVSAVAVVVDNNKRKTRCIKRQTRFGCR